MGQKGARKPHGPREVTEVETVINGYISTELVQDPARHG